LALLPHTMDENTGQYESLPEEDTGVNVGSNASSEVEMSDSPRKPGPVGERSTWAMGNHQDDAAQHQGTSTVTWSSDVARSMSEPPVSPRKGDTQDFIHMSTAEYRARALADMSDKHYESRMVRDAEEVQAEGLERMLETICEDAREDFISEPSDIEDIVEVSRQRRGTQSSARQDHQQQGEEVRHVGEGMKHALWQMWSFVSKTSDALVVPFEILLRLTIPIAGESFDKDVFTRACGLSPIWATLYLTSFSPAWWHILVAVGVGGILASLSWYSMNKQDTSDGTDTPPWVYGDSFPLIAILVAVYGFAVAGMWIDAIAGELVGVIHVFGIICYIKPSILGLTVLAWGNSLTDLVANMSVAMQSTGGASMAMTACFAGPLFNLLLGIGIGFILFFTDTGKTSVAVEFDSIVFVGCIFAMMFCIGVIAISITNGQRLPGWSGWLLMSWYGLYMLVIVAITLVSS
jgi:Ca2+/Na+ antiporter